MVSNFRRSSQAWKKRLKQWIYTFTFVAFLNIHSLLYFFFLFTWGVILQGVKLYNCWTSQTWFPIGVLYYILQVPTGYPLHPKYLLKLNPSEISVSMSRLVTLTMPTHYEHTIFSILSWPIPAQSPSNLPSTLHNPPPPVPPFLQMQNLCTRA